MRRISLVLFLCTLISSILQAQSKKPLTHDVYDGWKDIRNKQLSNDGNWFLYELTPQKGDAFLEIKNLAKKGSHFVSIPRGNKATFSSDNQFVVFKIKPQLATVLSKKRKKVKKNKLPKDSLGIYALSQDKLIKIPEVKSFKLPKNGGAWLAYQLEISNKKRKAKHPVTDSITKKENKKTQDLNNSETTKENSKKEDKKNNKDKKKDKDKKNNNQPSGEEEKLKQQIAILGQMLAEAEVAKKMAIQEKNKAEKEKQELLKTLENVKKQKANQKNIAGKGKRKKGKKESKFNGSTLILRNLNTAKQDTFPFVLDYTIAKNGKFLAFASTGDNKKFKAGVYVYDLSKQKLIQVLNKAGKHKNLVTDEKGTQLAFVSDTDTLKKRKKIKIRNYQLYHWQSGTKAAVILADSTNGKLKKSWIINQYQKPRFSKDGSKLYFSTNPRPILRDTSILREDIVNVEVWSWKDQRLFTEQKANLKRQKNRGFWAVAYPKAKKVIQLTTPEIPDISLVKEGNADFAIIKSSESYRKYTSWEGYPTYNDVYLKSFRDGSKKLLMKKIRANVRISPNGLYLYWYSPSDTAWFTYSFRNGQIKNLTEKSQNIFYDEFHDMPDHPRAYGALGWTENDASLLIYDRYDIWQISPYGAYPPKNITKNGREQKISYYYKRLNPEERFLKSKQSIILRGINNIDKSEGFYSFNLGSGGTPKALIKKEARLSRLIKAKNAERYIYTQETYKDFPDVYVTNNTFSNPEKITYANPQQNKYLWGSVELVKWDSFDGYELDGLLYKPENFDPNKKYPMIVYFYERVSDRLHSHVKPEPSWSTIRASVYTSNGYLVFMPDIPYKIGQPGKSAYNAIVSGTLNLINKGFVDKTKIGLQGQSWGGYQTAYLITQTDLFSAAMAGAPVSNMTSAYGGVRWRTGLSRMFQYEHTQSRIGATLWEKPMQYIENSPIFYADKVNTPLLMMHNDNDGAVPWYQGIEYYMALRRLNKPVWLLNYNGESHNLRQRKNRQDLSIRMMQFFDYYLKFKDAPQWMDKGMPASEKGIRQGYEIKGE